MVILRQFNFNCNCKTLHFQNVISKADALSSIKDRIGNQFARTKLPGTRKQSIERLFQTFSYGRYDIEE